MQSGGGLLFYLRMDGRGVGLAAKVAATRLEVAGVDTVDSRVSIGVEPEGRSFAAVGRFLADHGISKVRLLTNNPKKISDIQSAGVDVFRVPLVVPDMTVEAQAIHETKVKRLGHFTSD
jgi:GTP cyclohydrolase II